MLSLLSGSSHRKKIRQQCEAREDYYRRTVGREELLRQSEIRLLLSLIKLSQNRTRLSRNETRFSQNMTGLPQNGNRLSRNEIVCGNFVQNTVLTLMNRLTKCWYNTLIQHTLCPQQ